LSSRRHGMVILFVYRRFRQAVSVLNQYVSSSRQRANRRRHGEIILSDFSSTWIALFAFKYFYEFKEICVKLNTLDQNIR